MRIGKRLRELRKEKDITLEELSERSGVALATLSRMENNKMPGTIESHINICKVLGVSITELYRELEDESKTVEPVLKKNRAEHFIHGNKTVYELLVTKTLDKKILPLIMKISPGGETQEEHNPTGVEKFIYVMQGSFEASIGKTKYFLKKGDSLYFDASLPHSFKNKSKGQAEAICVMSPSFI
ncbi:MAG: XRE family transcriptional regulator [Candidatus Omnitrophota bacterium]